ncbi:hypothetical protein R6Q57_010275 [Mikania cordata]
MVLSQVLESTICTKAMDLEPKHKASLMLGPSDLDFKLRTICAYIALLRGPEHIATLVALRLHDVVFERCVVMLPTWRNEWRKLKLSGDDGIRRSLGEISVEESEKSVVP